MLAIYAFCLSLLVACLAYIIRPLRILLASISLVGLCISAGFLAANLPYVFGIGFGIMTLYQAFNIARLVAHRLHAKHLKKAFLIGGSRILALQTLIYALGELTNRYDRLLSAWGYVLPLSQVVVAIVVFALVVRRLIESQPKNIDTFLSDRELPTVSVLIPARNEDTDLVEALKCVVANDYPKLEILVLDDCSATARIPEIVKDFAHDGVRFVQGDIPKENWLPKNQAYETLANNVTM